MSLLLRAVALFALLCAGAASPAVAAERYAVIVSGASGGGKYAVQQDEWREILVTALKVRFEVPDANVAVLDEASGGSSMATADNVRRLLTDLRRRVTRDDTVLFVLLGHGTIDGADAKFNLVGPDLTAGEWQGMLDGLAGRLVVVNTTESSYPFIEQLSRRGRVVITATDSVAQRFATVFAGYFVRSLADLSSDFDKNGRLSIWEAFTAASAGVRQYYEQRGQLSTERPLLDDDGDRVGTEAQSPGADGAIARAFYLDATPGTLTGDAELTALERQRDALQRQLEELKGRRWLLMEEEYEAEVEKLLIQIARITRRIRERS